MKIAVASICSAEYAPLGEITYRTWRSYCEQHGYSFVLREPQGARGVNWQKLDVIAELLRDFDLVLWVGCDTLCTNPHVLLDGFWHAQECPEILVSADMLGINSDVMLFHKSDASEMFLFAVRDLGHILFKDHHWTEQEAIIRFAYQMPHSQWVKVIPQKGFNSYLHAEHGRPSHWPGNWEEGDWILHLPGMSMERRLEIARRYAATED